MDLWEDALARLRAVCTALPEVQEEPAWVGTRWQVRRRTFAHVLEVVDGRPESHARRAGTRGPAVVLTFRSSYPELDALLGSGGGFFGPLWGRDDVGVVLSGETDWDEIAELVTESYRVRAPARLAARLDPGNAAGSRDR